MNIKVIYTSLQNKIVAAVSRRLPRTPRVFAFLNGLSYPAIVYPTFEKALEVCRKLQPERQGQGIAWLVEANFHTSSKRSPNDYATLYSLMHIGKNQPLRVFDFGGGAGQSFLQYADSLPPGKIEKWIVCDTPEIIAQAQQILQGRQDERLHFTSSLPDCQGCNVFHAAGSLHYWGKSIRDLARELQGFPEHIIINRTPMRSEGPNFITIQQGNGWAVPCTVYNSANLAKEFMTEGFQLVEQWDVKEHALFFTLMPEYCTPYQGMYLKRIASSE